MLLGMATLHIEETAYQQKSSQVNFEMFSHYTLDF
jgi:hypothetical protein